MKLPAVRLMTIVAVASLLSGCATSSAGLYRTAVDLRLESDKTPQQVATCAAETMIGNPDLRNEGDHYWVLRTNGYAIPVARWDFMPRPGGGTIVELRATININSGDERVRACL